VRTQQARMKKKNCWSEGLRVPPKILDKEGPS
jgi:hypothetical protein